MTRRCYSCKETKDLELFPLDSSKYLGRKYECKSCKYSWYRTEKVRKYQKEYRDSHRERINAQKLAWANRNRVKKEAHVAVREAIRKGEINMMTCSSCGVFPTHAHHFDYAKPLEVIWLCSYHHKLIHRKF